MDWLSWGRKHQHAGPDVDGSPYLINPKFGDVKNKNYLEVTSDGVIKNTGKAQVYGQVVSDCISGMADGNSAPTLSYLVGTSTAAFVFSVNNRIWMPHIALPTDWEEGSDVELYVKWGIISAEGAAKSVKWQVSYSTGGVYTNPAKGTCIQSTIVNASGEGVINAADIAFTGYITKVGTVNMNKYMLGTTLSLSLQRITATGATPAYAPFCLGVVACYKKGSSGSSSPILQE